MLGARNFWFISLGLIALTIILNLFIRKIFGLGIIGDLLLYAQIIGFIGFLMRQKWGYFLTIAIQGIYLVLLVFPQLMIFDAVFQFLGVFMIYLSRGHFAR
ncbi:hypothetical protein KKH30_05115 [Candidatus Micrarchaeota archaeon]|nr:hypothetical protein [Candidatus Micrarchaeota archaeon]